MPLFKTSSGEAVYDSLVDAQLTAGNGPDVFLRQPTYGDQYKLIKYHRVLYLNGQPWLSRLPKTALQGINGKIVGFASSQSIESVYYDKIGLKSLGLSIPTTWTQLLSECDSAYAKGHTLVGAGYADAWTIPILWEAEMPSIVYGQVPNFDQLRYADRTTFASNPQFMETLQRFADFTKHHCTDSSAFGTTFVQSLSKFATHKYGLLMEGSWALAQLRQLGMGAELGMMALPTGTTSVLGGITVQPGGGWYINAATKHRAAALDWEEFWSRPSTQALQAQLSKTVPTEPAASKNLDPALRAVLATFSQHGVAVRPSEWVGWPDGLIPALAEACSGIAAGNQSPTRGAQILDRAWNLGVKNLK